MDRDEVIPLRDAVFIALGLVFRDAKADERTRDPAYGGSGRGSAQGGQKGACRDQWTDAGDGESADTGKQSQGSSQDGSTGGSRRAAFRSLGVLLMGKLPGAFLIREKDGYVIEREAGLLQAVNDLVGLAFRNRYRI